MLSSYDNSATLIEGAISFSVDHFLTIDQMACLLDLVEHVTYIVIPLVQSLICGLLDSPRGALLEYDDPLHAIDLGLNTGALDNHVA